MGWRSVAHVHTNGATEAIFKFRSLSRVIALKDAKNEYFWLPQNWSKMASFTPISQEWARNSKIASVAPFVSSWAIPRHPKRPTPLSGLVWEGGCYGFWSLLVLYSVVVCICNIVISKQKEMIGFNSNWQPTLPTIHHRSQSKTSVSTWSFRVLSSER